MSKLDKMKVIESNQLDFHPKQNLTDKDLQNLHGGLCNYMSFTVNGTCACDENCFLRLGKKHKLVESVPLVAFEEHVTGEIVKS